MIKCPICREKMEYGIACEKCLAKEKASGPLDAATCSALPWESNRETVREWLDRQQEKYRVHHAESERLVAENQNYLEALNLIRTGDWRTSGELRQIARLAICRQNANIQP